MAIVRNSARKRKETDPVFLRLYILGKVEGIKARLLKHVSKKGSTASTKDVDAMLAAAFALPVKKTKAKAKG